MFANLRFNNTSHSTEDRKAFIDGIVDDVNKDGQFVIVNANSTLKEVTADIELFSTDFEHLDKSDNYGSLRAKKDLLKALDCLFKVQSSSHGRIRRADRGFVTLRGKVASNAKIDNKISSVSTNSNKNGHNASHGRRVARG